MGGTETRLIGMEHLLRREKEGCFVTERLVCSLSKYFGSSSTTINPLTLGTSKTSFESNNQSRLTFRECTTALGRSGLKGVSHFHNLKP